MQEGASNGKRWIRETRQRTGDVMSMPQSEAMPSPFPPIEDYGFLSDCHTGALVAPDGSVSAP